MEAIVETRAQYAALIGMFAFSKIETRRNYWPDWSAIKRMRSFGISK